ncbi:MAG: tetratricopeptide repeat protein [Hyphomicrobiaceae bacterium]
MADSDIIREVEEDLRRERYQALWNRYGGIIVGAALVIIIGVAGYKGWHYWQQSRADSAGGRFEGALQLVRDGKDSEAEAVLEAIAKDAPAGYQTLARYRLAAEDSKAGRTAEALAQYQALADDAATDPIFRSYAQLKAAEVRVDEADFTEMQNRLTPLMAEAAPWRHSARELLGLAAYKAGEGDEAEKAFGLLIADPTVPQGMRQRAEMMLTLIAADTAKPPSAGDSN